jgi:hypothetical protein
MHTIKDKQKRNYQMYVLLSADQESDVYIFFYVLTPAANVKHTIVNCQF